jgi:hypothetical protein
VLHSAPSSHHLLQSRFAIRCKKRNGSGWDGQCAGSEKPSLQRFRNEGFLGTPTIQFHSLPSPSDFGGQIRIV